MTQPECNAGGDIGNTKTVQLHEVHIVLSDLHISEGARIIEDVGDGFWRRVSNTFQSFFRKESEKNRTVTCNPLEDFPHDEIFAKFLEGIIRRYNDVPHLRLRLLGDTFDPLAVRWNGKFVDQPFEEVAVYKMQRIIDGHPLFFDALASFLEKKNTAIDLFVGNHDQFLVWDEVQELIFKRLSTQYANIRSRLRFVDQNTEFTDVHRRVLYYHGMNAEPSNEIDPKRCVLTQRFGVPLPKPVLNMPVGSYMIIRVVNAIKRHNPCVGRLHKYSDVWKNAALHRWGWGLYAGFALFWTFVHSQLFAFWNIRRKTSLVKTFRIVLATIYDDSVDRYAERILRERDDVDVIVMGHSHEWRRVSGPSGTYINTGAWSIFLNLVEPEFPRLWSRFPRIEKIWRGFLYFLSTGQIRFAAQLTKVIGYVAVVIAMIAFLVVNLPAEEGWQVLSFSLNDFKVPIGILLLFVLASGVIRLFAVTPEVEVSLKLTFGIIEHGDDDTLNADLMEYIPDKDDIRECM